MNKREIVHLLASMTDSEFRDAVAEARGDGELMKSIASEAIRRKVSGHIANPDAGVVEDSKAALNDLFRRNNHDQ